MAWRRRKCRCFYPRKPCTKKGIHRPTINLILSVVGLEQVGVFESDGFNAAVSAGTLSHILASDELSVASELVLYEARQLTMRTKWPGHASFDTQPLQ